MDSHTLIEVVSLYKKGQALFPCHVISREWQLRISPSYLGIESENAILPMLWASTSYVCGPLGSQPPKLGYQLKN